MFLRHWSLIGCLSLICIGVLDASVPSVVIGENGAIESETPYVWSTETIGSGSVVVTDGGSVSIKLHSTDIAPEEDGTTCALQLNNGISATVEETAAAFDIGNSLNLSRAIQATGERSSLALSLGNVTAKTSKTSNGIALDGGASTTGLLDLTLGGTAQSNISGHLAMRGIHSFLINNTAGSWQITGIADISAAENARFTAQSILALAPEKDVETYIKLGATGVQIEEHAKLQLILPQSIAKGDSIKIIQWADAATWDISQLENFDWDVLLGADSQKSDWQWKNDGDNRQILLRYAGPYWQTIDGQTPLALTGGIFTDDQNGHCGQIYFLPPVKNNGATTLQLVFTDGTMEYAGDSLGAPIVIDTSSDPRDGNGVTIRNASWENATLCIDLGADANQILIKSALTPAIGQGITPAEGQSSDHAENRPEFITPALSFRGSGIVEGTRAYEMRGIANWGDAYDDSASMPIITLGSVMVGETTADNVHLRGGIHCQLFPAENLATGVLNGTYTLGDFVLSAGSAVEGAVIWDGSVQTGGDCLFGGIIYASDPNTQTLRIEGSIAGQPADRAGFCNSNAIWANGSATSTVELGDGCFLFTGDFLFSGSVQSGTPESHYSGIVLDNSVHQSNPNSSVHYKAENFFGGGIGILGGQINVNAPSGFGVGMATRRFTISENLDNDLIGNALVIATDKSRSRAAAISGSDVGLIFEGMNGDSPLQLSLLGGEITGTNDAAIVAHDAKIYVMDTRKTGTHGDIGCGDFLLHGPRGIRAGSGRYDYENGATFVTGIDGIPLRDANLSLHIDSNNALKIDGNAEVTTLTQSGNGSGGLDIAGRLTIGKNATISGGTFNASGGVAWVAEAAANEKSREILRFDAGKMNALHLAGIDASGVGICDLNNSTAPLIEIIGKDENATYVTGNILGNNATQNGNSSESYLQLKLGGGGGKIRGDVTNLGLLAIETQDNGKIWTVEGELSCGKLKISKGHFVQKGKITVWGNVLLLGCDFSWEDAQFNDGFYGKEDKIWARENSKAIFRNGFCWGNEAVKCLTDHFQSQAILLGGDAQLVVDEGVGKFQIEVAGAMESSAERPVAIRIPEFHECRNKREWLHLPENYHLGYQNTINLAHSLDIRYFDHEGQPFHGAATAIRGNDFTTVNLRGSHGPTPHSFAGTVEHIGRLNVSGHWFLPDGISSVEQLQIGRSARLNLGDTTLGARFVHFDLDSERQDAYLLCSEILPQTYFEVCCDAPMLANPAAQRYLLMGELTNAATTRNRIQFLNFGDFSLVADGHDLYLALPENDGVDGDNPRHIAHIGLLSPLEDAAVAEMSDARSSAPEENPPEIAAMAAGNAVRMEDDAANRENAYAKRAVPRGLMALPRNGGILRSEDAPASRSLAQARVTQQQLFQLRKQLLDGSHGNSQITGQTTFYWENFAGFSRRQYATGSLRQVDADHYGLLLGAEKYLGCGISLRGLAGYGWVSGSFYQPQDSREDSLRQRSFLGGAKMQWQSGNWQWQWLATATFDCHRHDHSLSSLEKIREKFNGCSLGFASEITYGFPLGRIGIYPQFGIGYDTIHHGEHADGDRWTVASYGAEFLQTWLGIRMETPAMTHGQGYGEISWINECHRRGENSKVSHNGTEFQTSSGVFGGQNLISARLGMRYHLGNYWHGDVHYSLLTQHHLRDHAFGLQLTHAF